MISERRRSPRRDGPSGTSSETSRSMVHTGRSSKTTPARSSSSDSTSAASASEGTTSSGRASRNPTHHLSASPSFPALGGPRTRWSPGAYVACLLYTSEAADDLTRVDLGGRRIIKKKKKK